jgi:hypothetical protein
MAVGITELGILSGAAAAELEERRGEGIRLIKTGFSPCQPEKGHVGRIDTFCRAVAVARFAPGSPAFACRCGR